MYSQPYDDWHNQLALAEKQGLRSMGPWHLTVVRLLPDLDGMRVLEIGCGRGDFAISLAAQYETAEVVGVDFSAAAIDTAQGRARRAGSRARFIQGDAEALPFPEATFDHVISCECMEHVPRPARMAEEINRVLRPGAAFILTTENYFNGMLLAWLKSWVTRTSFNSGSGVQPHENFFLFWRVGRLLKDTGLLVTHTESNHYQWLLLPRVNPALLATPDVRSRLLRRLFHPFGRHFTYCGIRPTRAVTRMS
jgi:ubiquinone/menaquinone biosynthesis C-methylase UbiE